MNEDADLLLKAQAAVDEAKANFGDNDIRVSYKLDELADALKRNGRLLDAANASARARSLRTVARAVQSDEQARKYGEISSDNKPLSAVGWLKKLHSWAIVISLAAFVIVMLVPLEGMIKGLVATTIFGTFIQLLLFPVKSIPRLVKWVIVAAASGAVGLILFR